MGGILDMAREDARQMTFENDGFETALTITDTESNVYEINGLVSNISYLADIDSGDFRAVSNNATVTFCEASLTELGAVTRTATGQLDVQDWLVEYELPEGQVKFKIVEPFPAGTLGLIKALLPEYE